MLQRSPTYVASRPDQDKIANTLRKYPAGEAGPTQSPASRTCSSATGYTGARAPSPEKVKKRLLGMVSAALGEDYTSPSTFTPSYNPWDQRLCLMPNSDLYQAIKARAAPASSPTPSKRSRPTGIRLLFRRRAGRRTSSSPRPGSSCRCFPTSPSRVDGDAVSWPDTIAYKGMMYADIPNMVQTFGYINASWTLQRRSHRGVYLPGAEPDG